MLRIAIKRNLMQSEKSGYNFQSKNKALLHCGKSASQGTQGSHKPSSAMRKNFSVTICIATALLILQTIMSPVLDGNALRAEEKRVVLEHADIIEGGEGAMGGYRSVIGNVLFRNGSMTLRCDRATEYEQAKRIVMQGNVVITDNTVEIYGDNGIYYLDREIGELTGNVRGRVTSSTLSGVARKAVFNKGANEISLYDDAIAWHEQQQISGEIIVMHIREQSEQSKRKTIDKVEVTENAFFAARDTLSVSPVVYNQFSGKKMVILLGDDSTITSITLTGQAESLYHLYENNRKPSGINYSSGKSIRLYFADGNLKRVKMIGNVEGKQYPESLRGEKSINLPKFVWREDKQPFKEHKSHP